MNARVRAKSAIDAAKIRGAFAVHLFRPVSLLLTVSAAALALSACAVGPNFVRPGPPPVTEYLPEPLPEQTAAAQIAGGDAQRFLRGADVPGQWWRAFGSEELNTLVEQALLANPDLDAAQAALRQAEQTYLASRGPLLPSITGNASISQQESSTQSGGGSLTLYNSSVGVSYLLDVFGGVRRSIEASDASRENQQFQLEATYTTLISNVLTAAIQEASLTAQLGAVNEIIAAQTQALDLITQQFELGAVARGDVLAQQAQLTATQAGLPTLQRNLAQVRTQLTVLLGRFPAEDEVPEVTLADLQLPTELPLSVPSRLVEQRPDIRQAEALLRQASANIGVATANMLPQINLTGNFSANTTSAGVSFLSPDSFAASLTAGLTAPIFRGGQLARQRQAAVYAFERSAAQYRSTVLAAFANVANVLNALRLDAETLRVQLIAADTASQNLDITTERFRAGAIAYLPLLDAQRTLLQARISLAQAQAARYADTVALFTALGGGWWNRDDIEEDEPDYPLGIAIP
jgi:NodT family efflux transporter outer membrane factor (OMF) lipoprotein